MKKSNKTNLILLAMNFILGLINFYLFVNVFFKEPINRKPILYLYPKKKQTIKIKLAKEKLIKTSYPKYHNGWEVQAAPNGNLKINNKDYYALYWDELYNYNFRFQEGFYIEKENAITFLEEKLNIIGLNEREANEFIMFWLPILEANEKNIIYFELTEERQRNNKLIITPRPDSLLRIVVHIKKVKKNPNLPEQKLTTFKRQGFVAVEWGGVNY